MGASFGLSLNLVSPSDYFHHSGLGAGDCPGPPCLQACQACPSGPLWAPLSSCYILFPLLSPSLSLLLLSPHLCLCPHLSRIRLLLSISVPPACLAPGAVSFTLSGAVFLAGISQPLVSLRPSRRAHTLPLGVAPEATGGLDLRAHSFYGASCPAASDVTGSWRSLIGWPCAGEDALGLVVEVGPRHLDASSPA